MDSLADGTLLGQPWWHFVLVAFFAGIGWTFAGILLRAIGETIASRGRRSEER